MQLTVIFLTLRAHDIFCCRHQASRCQFSNCPDMYNMCQYAHSSGELDEWKERWRWRQMKREIARTDGMYSYMESLLEEYDAADSGVTVVSPNNNMYLCEDRLKIKIITL